MADPAAGRTVGSALAAAVSGAGAVAGSCSCAPAGAARLADAGDGVAKAERVAVNKAYRRKGVGDALMKTFEREAKKRGFDQVLLGAQLGAMAFYSSLGYVAEGEEYLDARIRHRWMRKTL